MQTLLGALSGVPFVALWWLVCFVTSVAMGMPTNEAHAMAIFGAGFFAVLMVRANI